MVARSGVRFTADDIWETPDDGNRYEVIDGELYVTPPPIWVHQLIVSNLLFLIRQHIQPHDLGKVVPAPVGVVLDDESGVQPDLVYVSRERLGIIAERGVEGAPGPGGGGALTQHPSTRPGNQNKALRDGRHPPLLDRGPSRPNARILQARRARLR